MRRQYGIRDIEEHALQDLIEQEDITVLHQARYIPVVYVETEQSLEALRERLPDYTVFVPEEKRISRGEEQDDNQIPTPE